MSASDTLPPALRRAMQGLLLLTVGLAGCGPRTVEVSGTVTFNREPLPSGTVLFHGADGRVEHSLIGANGKYNIDNAPIGTVRITVQSHGAAPPKFPPLGEAPPVPPELGPRAQDRRDNKHVPIPNRYNDPEKSGLTYTVSRGTHTHNIELQP